MNTFMEQFAEARRWIGRGQHGLQGSAGSGRSIENRCDLIGRVCPGAPQRVCLIRRARREILPRLARLSAARRPRRSRRQRHVAPIINRDDSQELVGLLLQRGSARRCWFIARCGGAAPRPNRFYWVS